MTGKRVVIAGGTGFIGRRLVERLVARGDAVTILSRHPERSPKPQPVGVQVAAYTPNAVGPWFEELGDADAVVNLAGEPLVGVRWTDARKKIFEESRIDMSATLVAAIARLPESQRPRVVVGGSGVGYYGSHGADEDLDEQSPPGDDYVATLARKWEEALAPAEKLGVRVAYTRIGLVLGKGGGALEKMSLPFRIFVGGPIGSGKQMVSWVHIDDVCGTILTAIDNERARGPLNTTAPNPVSMDEFTRAIGKVLHRPSYFRVPAFAVKTLFGEGAEPLLTGQRALPKALLALGYSFEYPELVPALASVLGSS